MSRAIHPHFPTWCDGRNPDWERTTRREMPAQFAPLPVRRPQLRARLARWWRVIEGTLALAGALGLIAYLAAGLTS